MSNTFGNRFKLTTYGESHGPAIGGVIDGCPSGIPFDRELLASEMGRRHIGALATSRCESDEVTILSGLYEGMTLGTPIAFKIANNDKRSDDYDELETLFRPGHADYTYEARYGIRDHRGGGRASGRETAARVVGGAVAKMLLRKKNISISANITQQGVADDNDSAGGVIECTILGLPAGIGNPVFGKLNAQLAAAMMSIPSAIGFEMGAGFAATKMKGSEFRDEWNGDNDNENEKPRTDPSTGSGRGAESGDVRTNRRRVVCLRTPLNKINGSEQVSTLNSQLSTITNHSGGIQGGISNGMPIVFRTAFHPVVTIDQPTKCIDTDGHLHTWQPRGRHDRCHIPRTVVVVEAMAAMVIADFLQSV